jgi:hypothetical protein
MKYSKKTTIIILIFYFRRQAKEVFMIQNHYNTIIVGAGQSDLTLPSPKGEGNKKPLRKQGLG